MNNRFKIFVVVVISLLLFTGCYYEPEPVIKHGEFPFSLEYEYEGILYTYNDEIICDYLGYDGADAGAWYVEWDKKLKNGQENKAIYLDFRDSDTIIYDKYGNQVLYFWLFTGNAEYYMNTDSINGQKEPDSIDKIKYTYVTPSGEQDFIVITPEEAYERFSLRLLNFEVALPIENTFNEVDGLDKKIKIIFGQD